MIVFIDFETTKLMRKDVHSADATQPALLRAAAMMCSAEGEVLDFFHKAVRLPEGASVHPDAEKVHGISTRQARQRGGSQTWVMYGLLEMMAECRAAISYGDFDREVGASIIDRIKHTSSLPIWNAWSRPGLTWVNVMDPCATAACRLPSDFDSGGYRWPKLGHACEILLGDPPAPARHDAWEDCQRVRRLYQLLVDRKIIEAEVQP